MYSMSIAFSFIIILPLIFIFLSSHLFMKWTHPSQLLLPFECGFTQLFTSRNPFSVQFFLLAILFLIFDIEITLLLPIPLFFPLPNSSLKTLTILLFILAIFVGVLLEWHLNTLNWIK